MSKSRKRRITLDVTPEQYRLLKSHADLNGKSLVLDTGGIIPKKEL